MRKILFGFSAAALVTMVAMAADAPAPGLGKVLDGEIKAAESEIVSLAEAMPADKYDFAPTGGEFSGVRTFSQQMSHIAAVIYLVSANSLGEKNPSEAGPNENGPATLKGKDAVVKYLKDAFTYGHKAAANLTAENALDAMPSPFGSGKMPRMAMVSLAVWHSFDHYGQSVIYARMNGIVPPASRPRK
ncbi:MAG TPA: DinB family protein [Bryobacteraceae bacterium]|nr:DinB family protein [Bryobacteraceae bacterium]